MFEVWGAGTALVGMSVLIPTASLFQAWLPGLQGDVAQQFLSRVLDGPEQETPRAIV
jgi:hypothetical protein